MSNDKFPMMLYRHPGNVKLQNGLFATRTISSDDELSEALAGGFYATPAEALANSTGAEIGDTKSKTAGLGAEVDKLRGELEEGLKKLEAERKQLEDDRAVLQREIDSLAAQHEALGLERDAIKEGRESLEADRKAFEAEKAASTGKKR